jgi:hypothetical protein
MTKFLRELFKALVNKTSGRSDSGKTTGKGRRAGMAVKHVTRCGNVREGYPFK